MSSYFLILSVLVLLNFTEAKNIVTYKVKDIHDPLVRVYAPRHKIYQKSTIFDEKNVGHWRKQAQWTLKQKVSATLNKEIAKNVIFFLGDGMSLATLAATRVYLGRKYGYNGEEIKLSFETLPYTGLAKTYCVDNNVADSACSGTAYMTGVKANSGTVGVSGGVKRGDCAAQLSGNFTVNGLTHWAQRAGKSTGVVTTTRVTHATPASTYAHSADRLWESDTDKSIYATDCNDIATQFVRGITGSHIDVMFGGGRRNFLPKTERDQDGIFGHRNDNINLIREWISSKRAKGSANPKFVFDRKGLLELKVASYDSFLGLFSADHMPYRLDADPQQNPSLSEMTVKAIELLSDNENGYFLFIEGGRIDTAHHETKARKALDETAEFAKAVEAALEIIDLANTLIVVTADHSHTMSYSGYSKRGTDILGFTSKDANDKLPFTTLSYANGPGYKYPVNNRRYNMSSDDLNNPDYLYPTTVPMNRETHGGEDVAVFAHGPWAHLFTGNFEQNYIPHAIAFAACIGDGMTACNLGV